MANQLLEDLTMLFGKVFQRKKRVLILGLDGAGKTSILCQLMKSFNHPNECVCGQSMNVNSSDHDITYKNVEFKITEVGGSAWCRRLLWQLHRDDAKDGLIYVIDSTDMKRLNEAKRELLEIVKVLNVKTVLVMANKQDVPNSLSRRKIKKRLNLKSHGFRKFDWRIHPVSALTGDGIMKSLAWFTGEVHTKPKGRRNLLV